MVVCIVFGLYVVCATFADLTMAFVFLKDSVIYASVVESIADFLELALQFGMIDQSTYNELMNELMKSSAACRWLPVISVSFLD